MTNNPAKKGMSNQQKGQLGVNVVERVVLRSWSGRWQPLDAQNDDGVDGLIFLEAGGRATGQIIFAQIKCHAIKPELKKQLRAGSKTHIPVSIGNLDDHIQKWRRVVGAAILIHVDPATLKARWVDVLTADRKQATVFVPFSNRFNKKSRSAISLLTGSIHRDLLLPLVHTEAADFAYIAEGSKLSSQSLTYYNKLKEPPSKMKDGQTIVRFTKEGWQHITRPRRRVLTRLQSQLLLGAIPKILAAIEPDDLSPFKKKTSEGIVELWAARALVTFPFRQSAVVKILMKAGPLLNGTKSFDFYSIYEARRARDAIGRRR